MQNSAAATMRKSCRVGVIGLGSARVSRAGFGVALKHSFVLIQSAAKSADLRRKFAIARTRSVRAGLALARETRALSRRGLRASSLFLHHEDERADQRCRQ